MMNVERTMARHRVEADEEWMHWRGQIPALKFPADWAITITPPFGCAMVRFRVNDGISVYLDCHDALGIMGEPYWEVYPVDGDTARFLMHNTDGLLKAITRAVAQEKEND
jgi:hypothetical protein